MGISTLLEVLCLILFDDPNILNYPENLHAMQLDKQLNRGRFHIFIYLCEFYLICGQFCRNCHFVGGSCEYSRDFTARY